MSHRLPPCDHDECGPVKCERSGSLAQAFGSETLPPVVVLRADDWRDLYEVMRSLTWGKDCMHQWHSLKARVDHRNYSPNNGYTTSRLYIERRRFCLQGIPCEEVTPFRITRSTPAKTPPITTQIGRAHV